MMIINLIKDNPKITQRELGEKLNISKTSVYRRQKNLLARGILQKVGNNKTRILKVNE